MQDHTPQSPPIKQCTKCKAEHPNTPENFYRNRSRKDGLSPWCKACDLANALKGGKSEKAKARKKRWREAHREEQREYLKRYYRQNIERLKDYQARYSEQNRARIAARVKRYAAANRARFRPKVNADMRKWRAANPESAIMSIHRVRARAVGLPATATGEEWQRALEHFQYRCAVCDRSPDLFTKICVDHWIPLSWPDCPGTVATNLVPLCHGRGCCNDLKHMKHPAQWLTETCGPDKAAVILARIEAYFATVRDG